MGKGGLEPPRPKAHDPKSCSSANSDTSPRMGVAFRQAASCERCERFGELRTCEPLTSNVLNPVQAFWNESIHGSILADGASQVRLPGSCSRREYGLRRGISEQLPSWKSGRWWTDRSIAVTRRRCRAIGPRETRFARVVTAAVVFHKPAFAHVISCAFARSRHPLGVAG